jgi:hypothetical protein
MKKFHIMDLQLIEKTEEGPTTFYKVVGRNDEEIISVGDKLNNFTVTKIEQYGKETNCCYSGHTCMLTLEGTILTIEE